MKKTALRLVENEGTESHHRVAHEAATLALVDLRRHGRDWVFDCEYRQCSPQTLAIRRFVIEKLLWFLERRGLDRCGHSELRQFLAYCGTGHAEPGGRWGNPRMTKPVRPRTIHTYYGHLKSFSAWLVSEEIVSESLMARLPAPIHRSSQVQPFAPEQVAALLEAARHSQHKRRDEAIILFLLDTGVRASELCGLKMSSIDLNGRRCTVLGKGNKARTVFYGGTVGKALWQYLREASPAPEEPVFTSDRGTRAGEALTRSGLLQLIERLGKAAGLQAVRCSPHTFRHTFAVEFLRGGGNAFSLQQMLGHTALDMCRRYVALAQGDIENQHRQYSPADRLKRSAK